MPPGPVPINSRLPSASSSSRRSRAPTANDSTQRMRRPPPPGRRCNRRVTQPATRIIAMIATRLTITRNSSPPTLMSAAGNAAGARAATIRFPIDSPHRRLALRAIGCADVRSGILPARSGFTVLSLSKGEFTALSPQLAHALGGADHVGQADAELLVDHHHLAVRDQRAVDEHVQRLAGGAVQLHHRALVQLQQVADADAGAADLHGQGHRHVEDHVQVDVALAGKAVQGVRFDAVYDRGVVGSHALFFSVNSPDGRISRRPTWVWNWMAVWPLVWP